MLSTIFVILFVLWLLGIVTSYTLGGLIHLLLMSALVALIFQRDAKDRVTGSDDQDNKKDQAERELGQRELGQGAERRGEALHDRKARSRRSR